MEGVVNMGKRWVWIIISLFIIIAVVAVTFLIGKVTVTAPATVLTEQVWRASFSSELKAASVETGNLYITNAQGKRVATEMILDDDKRTILVKGLTAGSYTFHMNKSAVTGNKTLQKKELKFVVQDKIEAVSSAEELKAYFEQTLALQNKTSTFSGEMEMNKSESSADSAGASDHSTTNNQVEGVDEADTVKIDDSYIYSLSNNGKLIITDIRDPKKMKKASELTMEDDFYASQLFLHGDTLIVLGEKYEPHEESSKKEEALRIMPIYSMTMARLYNVSNRENPSLIREVGAEGYMSGARKTGDILYVITNVYPNFWELEELDGSVLRPRVYDSAEGDASTFIEYKDIAILPGVMEPSYSVITAITLSSPADNKVVTKGYLGGSEQLYMSADNLYLTAALYNYETAANDQATDSMMWRPGNANTEVFKFSLNGTNVEFLASAELKGSLLNQFSMDEYEGHFRVVTTEGNMWDEKNSSKNHLFILDENLSMTGSVEGLAKGERIYSARFMGDKAYMVTFRETDPLFVIDVANPSSPKVLGELKIPGFSNYLHPLDENHLIGFGYETVSKVNKEGGEPIIETLGMKISLFDVSDFENPKEKDTEIIGGRGTYSQIQYDHKALFTHGKRSLYGFPIMIYEEGKDASYIDYKGSGALIYEITPDKGIQLKGDLVQDKKPNQQYEEWEKEVQRILYNNEVVYTIAMNEIKSYSLDTFSPIDIMLIN